LPPVCPKLAAKQKSLREKKMRAWRVVLIAAAGIASGCASGFSWTSNRSINGNNTGGIVPEAVTNENDQMEMARAHCAQYDKQMRVTARPSETGGKLIFVCERPGTPPPSGAAPPPSSGQGELPPDVRMKKK
jgi:hypothetical protein